MINFDNLPTERVNNLIPDGKYKAVIEKAEIKLSKTGNSYLSLQYTLTDTANKPAGKLFDMQFDSDKALLQFKLSRFITALQLGLTGTFELKDLAKIIVGKKLIVAVSTDEKSDPPKNQVDALHGDIYYPITEWAALTGAEIAANDAVEDTTETNSGEVDEY